MKRYLLYGSEAYAVGILRPLQAAIRSRGGAVAWFFDGPGAELLESGERLLDTVEGVRGFRPDAVLVPGNRVPDFFPGVKVEVFHGFDAHKRPDRKGHFRLRGFFDLYCTHGPTTTAPFRELAARKGWFEVAETGFPKMDPLFPLPEGGPGNPRPVVLYAPTFSPSLTSAPALLETVGQLSRDPRWQWRVKLHSKTEPALVEAYRGLVGPNLSFEEGADLVPLLREADVMISDTSSAPVEFLMLQRPVVTFRHRQPGPEFLDVTGVDEVGPAVAWALARPDDLMERIRSYTEEVHPYRDGRSSERVLDAADDLAARGLGHLRRKPLNLVRRLKIRRSLGYYGWS